MRKACVGAMDKSSPKEIVWETFPHRLFFGRESTVTWGVGGVAFTNPLTSPNDQTHMCLYRITLSVPLFNLIFCICFTFRISIILFTLLSLFFFS